jgi:hypothetical protein
MNYGIFAILVAIVVASDTTTFHLRKEKNYCNLNNVECIDNSDCCSKICNMVFSWDELKSVCSENVDDVVDVDVAVDVACSGEGSTCNSQNDCCGSLSCEPSSYNGSGDWSCK